MKFIHCSDLHLDAKMESKLSASRAKERREELLKSFSRLASVASETGVDGIIIAGDLFDTENPSARCRKLFTETVKKYSDIDFLVLPGNHDRAVFDMLDPIPNLKLFYDTWTVYGYEGINVIGSSNPDTSVISAHLNPEEINIVVLHGEDKTDFELSELCDIGVDYVALGHYHTYSRSMLDRRGVVCYSGCLEGRGFDECGEKGYSLVSIENGKLSSEFVPFGGRQLTEIKLDMSSGATYSDQKRLIADALIGCDRTELVRVTVTGTYEPEREKFYENIIDEYRDEFFCIEICDCSVIGIKPEDYVNDISLKGEFIRTVMKEVEDEAERSRIISYGLRALAGESVE